MKRFLAIMMVLVTLGSFSLIRVAAAGEMDLPLFKDPLPNYKKAQFKETDFDQHEFPAAKNKTLVVEGHYYEMRYYHFSNSPASSKMAIMRNYENAVKSNGGQVIYEASDFWETVLKLVKGGAEYWIHVQMLNGTDYRIFMILKGGMTQNIAITAQNIADNVKNSGKATLSGLYFDTAKTEVKPESEPVLQEIAKYLQSEPKLNFYVVGHTDNLGTYDANLKLSKGRADAVVKVLTTKYGIAPARLTACGAGPIAPVASNDAEDGRAQNRRVELVQQ